MANVAGSHHQYADVLSEYLENMAPINGPSIKAMEKAIPTKAIALLRFFSSVLSEMIVIQSDMFPLLRPPRNRAITNIKKFEEIAHIPYEAVIPI